MPCGCGQRRVIGARVVAAMRGGDFQEARRQMHEMARSAGQDLSHLAGAVRTGTLPRETIASAVQPHDHADA